ERARELIRRAQRNYVPVLMDATGSSARGDGTVIGTEQLQAWADGMLVTADVGLPCLKERTIVVEGRQAASIGTAGEQWLSFYRAKVLPKVSIVTVLYGKQGQIPTVLRTYFEQSYEGDIEVVFVDDLGPDDSVRAVEAAFAKAQASGQYRRLPAYKIVRNE